MSENRTHNLYHLQSYACASAPWLTPTLVIFKWKKKINHQYISNQKLNNLWCSLCQHWDSIVNNKGFPIGGDDAKEILITFKTRPGGRCQFNYEHGTRRAVSRITTDLFFPLAQRTIKKVLNENPTLKVKGESAIVSDAPASVPPQSRGFWKLHRYCY